MSQHDDSPLRRASYAVSSYRMSHWTHTDPKTGVPANYQQEPDATVLIDLLTDLRHWAHANAIDYAHADALAHSHWAEE